MASFFDRYRQGEYEAVWTEFQVLGAAVRSEPLLSEARAVTHETMQRVRYNLEILIPRLHRLGYQFGVGFTRGLAEQDARELMQQAPIYATPASNVDEQISELERLVGTLPLSLEAFYHNVGSVNLVGEMPTWEKLKPAGIENLAQFVQKHPDFDWSSYSLDHGLDPLFVWSVDMAITMARQLKSMAESVGDKLAPYPLDIAPDYHSKYGKGGSGPYIVELPCLGADAPLLHEWHHTTFVDYLRISLRWGGMPGLERATGTPDEDIAYLTDGFIPF